MSESTYKETNETKLDEVIIVNPSDYKKYEKRLIEINDRLKEISDSGNVNVDIGEVLSLRKEAKPIAKALGTFLKNVLD